VKILANPVVLRAIVVFFCAGSAFLLGLLFIRLLRKSIAEEANISSQPTPSLENMPMHVYNTVIHELKKQKHELQEQSQADQLRSRVSENFSQAVFSNLSSGVLLFGTNGLVKQSNPAAKTILGFASPNGMSAEDIFRGTVISAKNSQSDQQDQDQDHNLQNQDDSEALTLDDAVRAVLKDGVQRQVEADYPTPADEHRHLIVTVTPVAAVEGGALGAACLIDDRTELQQLRLQNKLQTSAAVAGATG
jgi:PAS domain-containing protein